MQMKKRCSGRYANRFITALILFCMLFPGWLNPWMAATPAHAAPLISFDGGPGTGAPPATLGPYTMLPFPEDTRPIGSSGRFTSVPGPTDGPGDLQFDLVVEHDNIPDGWATWSHSYSGDVYDNVLVGNTTSRTISLPPSTRAFYFYVEPNSGTQTFTATAQDGTSSGPVSIAGSAGAKYFGFYAQGGAVLSSITISTSYTGGFAVGEFGIFGATYDLSVEKYPSNASGEFDNGPFIAGQ
jgi:hypothetical protein